MEQRTCLKSVPWYPISSAMLTTFENDLFQNVDFLKSIVDSIEEGIVIQDKNGKIIGFNDNATEILSITSDQLLGKTSYDPEWQAIFPDGSPAPGDKHPITVTLRTGVPQHNVIMGIKTAGDNLKWLSINTRFIKQDEDIFVFAMFRDITTMIQEINEVKILNLKFEERNFELLRTQDELKRKINQLKVFTGIITHDVRGPAGTIKQMLEMYESETDQEVRKILFDCSKKSSIDLNHNLNELIQMLQIHIEENTPSTICDLDSLTARIFEELQESFGVKHARLVTDFKQPSIQYPKVYMQSILYNLLSNALKYTREGIEPIITLRSWMDAEKCFFLYPIMDSGLIWKNMAINFFNSKNIFTQDLTAKASVYT
jgi:PAS domain-containing protein